MLARAFAHKPVWYTTVDVGTDVRVPCGKQRLAGQHESVPARSTTKHVAIQPIRIVQNKMSTA
eukprot:6198775-Pleurochrysis_carterae.AAC.1